MSYMLPIAKKPNDKTIIEVDGILYVPFRPIADRFVIHDEDQMMFFKRKGFRTKEALDGKSWEVWMPMSQAQEDKVHGRATSKSPFVVGGK